MGELTGLALLYVKCGGAAIGSSIAVVFAEKPAENEPVYKHLLRLLNRFVIGLIFGVITAPIILDFFKWERTFDFWLAASAIGGLSGFMLLQLFFSKTTKDRFKKIIGGKDGSN